MSCTTDLPLADRRPDVEVLLVHDDVLTLPSRVRVGSPHALVFTPRTRNQREEQNQCSSQRFITVLITFSSRLLNILVAERTRCSQTGRGVSGMCRTKQESCPKKGSPTFFIGNHSKLPT